MAVQREQVVQTAEKYVSRGKIEPAIREYRKLLSDNPNDINTLNRIGDLYARIHKIDEAVDFFTQIAEQYSIEGFFVKAIAIYKKIIKLDPTRLEVYEKLAELYHKQGLVNEARTQYQVLADYYQKHANAASAIAVYQKMADLEPNNPTYHVKLAEIYQQQQLSEKAVNEYRLIAEMMIAHGRSTDAAQVYERALDIDSSNIGFINDAVLRLRESGNANAAARFLAHAVERNPQAAGIARLARVAEPEPEPVAEPVPQPRPAPPPVAAAPAPLPPVEEEPPVEIEAEPASSTFVGQLEEQSYEDYMASAVQQAQAPLAAAPADPAPAPAAEETEFELDLDEVFVLDIDEEEPTSMVKPPPDMASGSGVRLGSAWRSEEDSSASAAAVQEPEELEVELDLSEVEAELPGMGSYSLAEEDLPAALTTSGEIVLDLAEPDLPQIDSAVWSMEEEPAQLQAPREIDADFLERTAAELHPRAPERDEDLVSEAEVLAKYGLEDKALERLREALRIKPHSLPAYTALIQIHLDAGRHERVAEMAHAMARAASEVHDAQAWPAMRRLLLESGYRLDGDRVVAGPQGPILAEEPAPAPETAAPALSPFSLGMDLEAEAEMEVEIELEPFQSDSAADLFAPLPEALPELEPEPPAPTPAPEPVQAAPAPATPPPSAPVASRKRSIELDQMLEGLLGGKPKKAAPRPAPAPAPPPVALSIAAAPPPAPVAPPPPAAPAGPALFNPLEIGEMIEQEDDLDWTPAAGSGTVLPAQSPAAATPPAGSGGVVFPGMDDTGGMSWLDEAERNRPSQAGSDSLFDEEDDFFDLAAELEQELGQEDLFPGGEGTTVMQQAEQSLEDIVEGFKKGVAEHLSPTDYDTHFNLGIAYREMGLLDEAIGEFQVAAKDPGHLVLCCSMLGLCFLDKGLPELAIKWYRRGLEAPGIGEEDTLGLLYDLGCAYLAVEDQASAYKAFVDLYGINTNYRDVVARIEELGRDR